MKSLDARIERERMAIDSLSVRLHHREKKLEPVQETLREIHEAARRLGALLAKRKFHEAARRLGALLAKRK